MKKVIFVDDSKTILFSIEIAVEDMIDEGLIEVEYFDNPLNALDSIEKGLKPDLIFTDINMPEMTGFELIKKVRETGEDCPIIALTTEKTKEQKLLGKEAGMNAWLIKPFTDDKITSMITRVFKF